MQLVFLEGKFCSETSDRKTINNASCFCGSVVYLVSLEFWCRMREGNVWVVFLANSLGTSCCAKMSFHKTKFGSCFYFFSLINGN